MERPIFHRQAGQYGVTGTRSGRGAVDIDYGPTSGPLWGNAILTRLPVEDWSLHVLPPESLLLTRGLISADIDAGENRTLRVLATHLHHQANGGAIRLEQVEEIRRVWDGAENTVIAGDLNAESD